jgi:predicted amidohydrolase
MNFSTARTARRAMMKWSSGKNIKTDIRKEKDMAKIAAVQMKMSDSMDENYAKSIDYLKQASEQGVDFICYPEVQLTKFFPQFEGKDVSGLSVGLDHEYVRGFQEACKKYGIIASPNFFIEKDGHTYDANLIISEEGEILGMGKMVHIAQACQFYEQDYYTPSEEGFVVTDTSIGKIGIVVCFDRHYPESVRTCALKGADLVVIATANTKDEPTELFQWEVKVPAFQSSVNIVMCNRTGKESDMDFCGETIMVNADGTTAALADDKEQLIIADMDIKGAAALRKEKPYIALRRPELYL